MNRAIFSAAIAALLSASPAAAALFHFNITTSSLSAPGGPYALDLFFIDGGDGTSNTAVFTLFGESPVTLQDTFFTEQQIAFSPRPLLDFTLNITANPNTGAFVSPDAFYIALLQNGAQIATTDPSGGNALITVQSPTIAGGAPSVSFTDSASGAFDPRFASATTVPEPSTFALLLLTLTGPGWVAWRRLSATRTMQRLSATQTSR